MQPQANEEQTPSVQASIEASIKSLESDDADGGNTQGAVHEDQAANLDAGQASAEAGKAEAGDTTKPDADQQAAIQRQPKTTSITDTPARQTRGPASWKPDIREKFSQLPPDVQAEVTRREREISTAMQEAASTRQFAEQFEAAITPFRHIIALEGNDPIKTFTDYMKTATMLRTGSALEKANAIASAINTFGIDVTMLDKALAATITGQPMPAQQVGQQPVYQDPRVDQLFIALQRQQAEKNQALEAELSSEIENFANDPANEFYEDLRVDMADIMRMSAQRNRQVTLAEAYTRAAQLHPEISKVVTQREAAKNALKNKGVIAAKRLAGSSVRTDSPHQLGGAQEPTSVRGAIESAIEQLSN